MTDSSAATPSPTPEGLMIDQQALTTLAEQAQIWIVKNLISLDTTIQFSLIVAAFVIGFIIARLLNPFLTALVESLKLPGGLSGFLHRLRKLSGPILVLVILFFILLVDAALNLPFHDVFLDATMRLTAAWIIIRLAVRIIENRTARSAFAGIIWVIAALSIFGILDDTAKALDSLGLTLGDFRLSALSVTKAMIATFALVYAAFGLSKMLEHRLARIQNLAPGSRLLLTKISRIALIALAVVIGITMAGINLSMLAVFTGAVGLGVGLGLQRGISNLFTGMMLLMDKTVQPNDVIELPNGIIGIVRLMGSRCTEIVTMENKSYMIPNEDLVTNPVINWTRGGGATLVRIPFGVDYCHNPHEVIKIACAAAATVERVIDTQKPTCQLTGFGDSSLDFSMNFWINDPQNGLQNVKGLVYLALWDAFQAHGIKIPFPVRHIIQEG